MGSILTLVMQNKPKILFLVQLPPPIHGAAIINKYLQDSTAISNYFDTKFLNIATANEIKDIGSFSIKKIIKTVLLYFRVLKLILQENFEVVYITLSPVGLAFFKDGLFVVIAKLFRRKVVIHLHGKGIALEREKNFIFEKLYRFIFNNTYCICLSNTLVKDIFGLRVKKCFILNNGVQTQVLNYSINLKKNKTIQLLFLSNLIKEKGIIEFLEVCKRLTELNVKYKARIIGKPYDIKETNINEFVSANNIVDKIEYQGAKYSTEKNDILSKTDILIFPTKYKNEAFPLVLLEAMQFGIVPIATSEGGILDIIQDEKTGFIVSNTSIVDAIVKKVIFLEKSREILAEMSENCRNDFFSKYTIEKFEENTINIFNEVLIDTI
ncbi:MAG: glycosyltransferase family 4 protein [Chitinophagaceae bacterium]